jgi:hypothetical protein
MYLKEEVLASYTNSEGESKIFREYVPHPKPTIGGKSPKDTIPAWSYLALRSLLPIYAENGVAISEAWRSDAKGKLELYLLIKTGSRANEIGLDKDNVAEVSFQFEPFEVLVSALEWLVNNVYLIPNLCDTDLKSASGSCI